MSYQIEEKMREETREISKKQHVGRKEVRSIKVPKRREVCWAYV